MDSNVKKALEQTEDNLSLVRTLLTEEVSAESNEKTLDEINETLSSLEYLQYGERDIKLYEIVDVIDSSKKEMVSSAIVAAVLFVGALVSQNFNDYQLAAAIYKEARYLTNWNDLFMCLKALGPLSSLFALGSSGAFYNSVNAANRKKIAERDLGNMLKAYPDLAEKYLGDEDDTKTI